MNNLRIEQLTNDHFGREPDADGGFSWEKTDLVDAIKDAI